MIYLRSNYGTFIQNGSIDFNYPPEWKKTENHLKEIFKLYIWDFFKSQRSHRSYIQFKNQVLHDNKSHTGCTKDTS